MHIKASMASPCPSPSSSSSSSWNYSCMLMLNCLPVSHLGGCEQSWVTMWAWMLSSQHQQTAACPSPFLPVSAQLELGYSTLWSVTVSWWEVREWAWKELGSPNEFLEWSSMPALESLVACNTREQQIDQKGQCRIAPLCQWISCINHLDLPTPGPDQVFFRNGYNGEVMWHCARAEHLPLFWGFYPTL